MITTPRITTQHHAQLLPHVDQLAATAERIGSVSGADIQSDLDRRRQRLAPGHVSTGDAVALRRSLFQLFALLKIHLAEEQLYDDLVEHRLSAEEENSLAEAMRHEGAAPR